jgi:nitrogen fixation protein NifU and related proteins
MYSALVLDHFQNPRNVGEVERPDASAQLENPACGDILKLTLKITRGRITEARFRARGCVAAIACASKLTEMIVDRAVTEVPQVRWEDLVSSLGLPRESEHASHLAVETLAAALKQAHP